MNSFEKNITIIIVSFKSSHIIEKCIKSINSNIKIIIVENSEDIHIKNYLENKFSNVEVIVAKENLGYGKGNNLGISKANTQYVFILNPDTTLEDNCLEELYKAQLMLRDDFAIFDENFFLFLEEIDLCKRIKNNGGKIFVVQESKVQHSAKKASGDSLNIELCRNWHWMWSLFYYNHKHFGVLTAYRVTIGKFISSIIKLFIALILFNKKNFLIYYYRLSGLLNAFFKKSAWFRPDNL
jgi:GT2 family glycosyltransferase